MSYLAWAFACLGIYGLIIGSYGAAVISFILAPMYLRGLQLCNRRIIEYYRNPDNATVPKDSTEALVDNRTESGRTTF